MKELKVAIITNMPAPYRIPLFEKIAKIVDLNVYFTTYVEEGRDWNFNDNYNFKYKILPVYNLKFKGKDILNYHFNPSIIKELINNDYDVIISGGYASLTAKVALIISKLRRKPFILWSGSTLNEETRMRSFFLPIIKFLVRRMDSFLVYGTKAKEYIVSLGISPQKVFITINVANVDFFIEEIPQIENKKNIFKKEMNIGKKINILYVGRLSQYKGIEYLLEAFNKLHKEYDDVGLILVGNGPMKKDIEDLKEKIDGLYLVDFVQPQELPKFYTMADLFVIPSFYDRFSIVLSEAMASGLPVISTDKNGASIDLIREGYNGYIIKNESYNDFYEKIKYLLENPNLLEKMGENSKNLIINEFNLDYAVDGFLNAFDYVLKKNN